MSRSKLLRENPAYRRTYGVWAVMKDRCHNERNESYKNYGGRGITYSPSWKSFDNFLADMGLAPLGLTLDRIDNDGNYCKENCRWTDRATQTKNSRPRCDNTSGVRGVSWEARDKNWVAHVDGKCIYRGKSFEEAVAARSIWRP